MLLFQYSRRYNKKKRNIAYADVLNEFMNG